MSKHSSIFITNRVPYIRKLDTGHSQQSPGDFVAMGFQVGRLILQANAGKVLDIK